MKTTLITLLFLAFSFSYGQKLDYNKLIDMEQSRIDLIDGKQDQTISFKKDDDSKLATKLYISSIDQLQTQINGFETKLAEQNARVLYDFCKNIKKNNYNQLSLYKHSFELIQFLYQTNNEAKELDRLKTDLRTGLNISEFINLKSYAVTYWKFLAKFYPTDLLNKFKNLAYTPVGSEVVNAVAKIDPNAVKQYFGTNHIVDRALKNSKDSIVNLIYYIYQTYGIQSKSFALIHYVNSKQMELEDAETISKNPRLFYKTLIELRKKENILADYTVDKELQTLGMERVVEINIRHDKSDPIRFQPIVMDNAYEIYTAIVYSSEEIFTSSFLGMYKRMMEKRKEKSGYYFLENLNYNKFRVFIKQCAGYNKLDDFFGTMNDSQANALITQFAGNLYNYGGSLGPAVDVADTYGSLENEKIKTIFKTIIEKEFKNCIISNNDHGIKIYGLLMKLTGGTPENLVSSNYTFNIPSLDKVNFNDLYTDSLHIQQHFFFDDEDGLAAYNAWLTKYPANIYSREDKGSYIVLKTKVGKKMEIYANKPSKEFEGREALTKLFEARGRFPDLLVHRGHSYYIDNTLNNMTSSNKIAILGSCGGYQNISRAMESSPDVQIVSTKQVGTLAVNSVLIHETTETIRLGKDVVWVDLWKQISITLKNNPQFKDYIPPYKNLGARFIKAYSLL
ncbi:hypothetical protein [Flavobacterium filum]|uniref:hypothetical protein n=1 Tax=Flavobacterium filum TaxID=370974 RepID=UPI0023F13CDC|nr:hypothetical protein [Flavobacterium filum]